MVHFQLYIRCRYADINSSFHLCISDRVHTHHALPAPPAMMSPGRFMNPTSLAKPMLSGPRFQFLRGIRVVWRLLFPSSSS